MRVRSYLASLLVCIAFLSLSRAVFAQQQCPDPNSVCASVSDPTQRYNCFQNASSACTSITNQNTSYVNKLKNQIQLTSYRIESMKAIIQKLSGEISDLDNEVQRLEDVLTQRSELILHRIPESYKRASGAQFGMLFLSRDFSDFVLRVKYISTVQDQDAQLLLQLKATQNNFSERKSLREDKKKQQETAQQQLEVETQHLASQKSELDAVIANNLSDQAQLNKLTAEAQAQISAFRTFVTNLGGAGILSGQTYCDGWGCYYNQRDSQWGNKSLGGSNLSVAEYGCLVTSVAMVATHYGHRDITPASIAGNSAAFFIPNANTAYLWKSINVNGVTISRGWANIDSELSAGRPVIVGIGYGPSHFIVLKSGAGGNYIMNDPFLENGHDVPFSSKYSYSSITEVDSVSVN
jgi:peptidoglycan hydrolase CwlO-like protein